MCKVTAYMATPGGLTGAPRRLLGLASAFQKEGLDVCIASQPGTELLDAALEQGIGTAEIETKGVLALRHKALFAGGIMFRMRVFLALFLQNLRVLNCIRRQQADVVWLRGSKSIAFAGLGVWLSRKPFVWDVDYELPSRGIVRWLHRFALWGAGCIVFQYPQAGKQIFGEGQYARYRGKMHSIIPGIDLESLDRDRLQHKEGPAADSPFRILQVGTICDRKNQQLLVDALIKLKETSQLHDIHVRLVGNTLDETYESQLRQRVSDHGLDDIVEFLGWRTDIHDLMQSSDVLAMPSKDEGVPNTVQEAMALGLPVMVSTGGGMPSIVSSGETGWVLPPDDPSAWAKQILACQQDPERCASVASAATNYARENFGTGKWGHDYAKLIRGLIDA